MNGKLKQLLSNNTIGLKFFNLLTRNIILLFSINSISSENKLQKFNLFLSKIGLKIRGPVSADIYFYSTSVPRPNIVKINGDNSSTPEKTNYNFIEPDNYIELIWNNDLEKCFGLFYECSAIYDIDFSNFNTSLVKNMAFMFNGCSSLKNLNLSNFKTSQVTNMFAMFTDCPSLKLLDLSGFNICFIVVQI